MTGASYVDPILAQAGRDPDRPAVTGVVELTYRELLDRARDLASRLASAGCLPGDGIALVTGRDLGYLVGMLGIAIAGGTAVPVAADEPPPRRARLLRRLPVRATVTGDAAGTTRIDRAVPDTPDTPARHGIAYVLFTSGSTGTPRPVAVGHAALRRYLQWAADTLVHPQAPMPVLAAPSFDAILKQALAPLVRGSAVLLLPDPAARSPGELVRLLTGSATAYTINCVPSFWRAVLAEARPARRLALQRLLLGGEAVDQAVIAATRAVAPQAEIWNLYGPTEAAANATAAPVRDGGPPGLGAALPYAAVHVLDPGLRAAGDGETGEVYIGGSALAAGYLGDPRATAARFVPDPFSAVPGARMFRAGDLARLVGGELVFRGRADRQLKRRGVRVEPGEIESALREHRQVRDAVVTVIDGAGGQQLLAAVVEPATAAAAAPTTSDGLRQHLQRVLHPAAVPDIVAPVTRMPRTPAGKPDQRRIAELCRDLVAAGGAGATTCPDPVADPADPLQAVICAVWADVLGRQVTPEDNFFELGGHSIAMLRITGRLARLLDLDLGAGMLYDTPTAAEQAARIRRPLGTEADQRARKALADLGTG